MTVEVKEVLFGEMVAENGRASLELVEVVQRLVDAVRELQVANAALEARVTALEVFHP